ncbi:MBOAT family O-acyltransferase [Sphingobacterium sp. UBA6320]|uniref:MBOAT family O-acyltransferase n=1 Tax=Sphingobacterium sp. UBA6320 TaxID=1947510 RepID=UPI0025E6D90D|nr:MBOAT family O-acyltransferase [Sphingobacterium sp. UBA6320]
MPFASLHFLIFFCLVNVIILFTKDDYRSFLMLCASYYFYAWAGLSSLIYLFVISLITYFAAKGMEKYDKNKICYFAILVILILLLSSKYSYFPEYINRLTPYTFEQASYIIPIGISFYSLQAIALLVDIKNNNFISKVSFKEMALFISFFPQSLAGPIHRGSELIPQFNKNSPIEITLLAIGFKTLLFGLFCKLIVADKLALLIEPIFSNQHNHDGLLIYTSIILYSIQIYFDFWGYSLMAIGIGKCLGYDIKINFRNPYMASSIKDFWHRWHISLSQWMRDYVYIPLGGNRKGYLYFLLALFATFLLSGIWHGLSFNFIIWGLIHMLLFLIDDILKKLLGASKNNHFRRLFFLATIPFTWLIFRTSNFEELCHILKKIFFFSENWSLLSSTLYFTSGVNLYYLITSLLIVLIAHSKFVKNWMNMMPITNIEKILDSAFLITCLLFIILFGDIGQQQFLYFNF